MSCEAVCSLRHTGTTCTIFSKTPSGYKILYESKDATSRPYNSFWLDTDAMEKIIGYTCLELITFISKQNKPVQ